MSNDFYPYQILSAIKRIEAELINIVGEEDSVIRDVSVLKVKLEQATNRDEQLKLASQLIAHVATNEKIKDILNAELTLQRELWNQLASEIPETISLQASKQTVALTTYALKWQLDSEQLPEIDEISERNISIKHGGLGTGKSIKLKNLSLDIGEMSEIAAGIMLAGFNIIDKPHPFVIAAGILFAIRALTKAMTVQLSEGEISVFWGMIQARDAENMTQFENIVQQTNAERDKSGLDSLTERQVLNALARLEQLKSVEKVAELSGTWRIVERFKVR